MLALQENFRGTETWGPSPGGLRKNPRMSSTTGPTEADRQADSFCWTQCSVCLCPTPGCQLFGNPSLGLAASDHCLSPNTVRLVNKLVISQLYVSTQGANKWHPKETIVNLKSLIHASSLAVVNYTCHTPGCHLCGILRKKCQPLHVLLRLT